MIRLWIATLVLLALAVAGCGPDCDAYCNKVSECRLSVDPTFRISDCVLGCNDSGADKSRTIQCYIDHSCSDIKAGHCSVTGQPPQTPPAPAG